MKILCISDTHGFHRELFIPKNIDMIIHAGDSTNYWELYKNEQEFEDFLDWYSNTHVKYKVLIAGNHDHSLIKQYNKDKVQKSGIIYLEHESIVIEGIKIFGSPYTPTFGSWFFMVNTWKMDKYWSAIDKDTDILVTHGPPYGILDLTIDRNRDLKLCGDKSLLNHVKEIKPKYHVFGHIHDNPEFKNQGMLVRNDTNYLNVSCVTDSKFEEGLSSEGIVIEI